MAVIFHVEVVLWWDTDVSKLRVASIVKVVALVAGSLFPIFLLASDTCCPSSEGPISMLFSPIPVTSHTKSRNCVNVRNIGKNEAQHLKHKGLEVCGGQACYRSSV
jgi:hypothetical protein